MFKSPRLWRVIAVLIALGLSACFTREAGSEVQPLALISRDQPAFASDQNSNPALANDRDYTTVWRSLAVPGEGSPVWLAYDLSGAGSGQKQKVLLVYYNHSASYYPPWPHYQPDGNPTDYTIEANTASGGAVPENGWETLLAVTDNHYHSRQHVLDFGGYNWIRIRITGTEGDSNSGTDDAAIQLDVFDVANGMEDDWIFLGDSITSLGMLTGCRDSFAHLIHDASPRHTPAVENGGVPGTASGYGAANIGAWIRMFPGKYMCLAFGANDCDVTPERFYANYLAMVDQVQAAGKTAVVPTVPWPKIAARQAAVARLNEKIRELYLARPSVVKGPDLWDFFSSRQDLIVDQVHPGAEGNAAMRRLWADAMLTAVYAGIPQPASPTPSLTPTSAITAVYGLQTTLSPRAFPNPWSSGRQPVAIGPLAENSTVRIANAVGEVVAAMRATEAFVRWNPDRLQVATGVYFYMITDEKGNRWRGKIAVMR